MSVALSRPEIRICEAGARTCGLQDEVGVVLGGKTARTYPLPLVADERAPPPGRVKEQVDRVCGPVSSEAWDDLAKIFATLSRL